MYQFAYANMARMDAHKRASHGAARTSGASAQVYVLGTALAVSIIICGLVGMVRLLGLVILLSLLVHAPSKNPIDSLVRILRRRRSKNGAAF